MVANCRHNNDCQTVLLGYGWRSRRDEWFGSEFASEEGFADFKFSKRATFRTVLQNQTLVLALHRCHLQCVIVSGTHALY